MAKGFLKFLMLRMISEGDATGYQLIKHIESVTGSAPSTGSVYPMLKSMEVEGWIEGRKEDSKTIYSITDTGRERLQELEEEKVGHMMRLHQSISLANVTFEDIGPLMLMAHMDILTLLEPVLLETGTLLEMGVEEETIGEVVEVMTEMLMSLRPGDPDD